MTRRSLAGRRILLTRPSIRATKLAGILREADADIIHYPVIDITARSEADIEAQHRALPNADVVLFVSPAAVEFGSHCISAGALVGAVGPSTAEALAARSIDVQIVPADGFDSEHLLAQRLLTNVDGKTVRIVRGQSGRELLANTLAERGAAVDYLAVYDRVASQPDPALTADVRERLLRGQIDATVIMSVESLRGLIKLLEDPDLRLIRESVVVTPSARVIQTARDLQPSLQYSLASDPRATGMADAVVSACRQNLQT